jgi:tetratricopeptide (TPR) repeat protein
MTKQLISSHKENKDRKEWNIPLIVITLSCIVFLSLPVSAEVPPEEQAPLGDDHVTILESSHANAIAILELAGDNEILPLAYEKLYLGEEFAALAFSLNSTGLYEDAFEKFEEALELYGEAIIIASEATPAPSTESTDENTSDPLEIRGNLDRTWDFFYELNSTYYEQNTTVLEVETHLSEAFSLLMLAEEQLAEEDYEAASQSTSGASEALKNVLAFLKTLARESKAERALKFIDFRHASLRGLEEYLTQKYGILSSANSETFARFRNTNQVIRSLIENGEIDEALVELDKIHNQMFEEMEKEGLSKDDLKEMKALDKAIMKAKRLDEKNETKLDNVKKDKKDKKDK